MKTAIQELIKAHNFFVKESRSYIGKWSFEPYTKWCHPNTVYYGRYTYDLKDLIYYPIAYIKFMRNYL